MKNCFLLIVAVLMFFSCRQEVQVSVSSQWRGEMRDGKYNESGLLKMWAAEGPQLLWHYEGLGLGYTSVAIANNRLYVTGLIDDEDLVLFVFDLTGNLLNKKTLSKEWTTNFPGPRSTVCVNEGKLYVFNALGVLFCLDETTLDIVWKKDFLNDVDGKYVRFGITENPLIVGDKLSMTPGGDNHNMVALNKNTGELIWASPGTGTPSSYCSPIFIDNHSIPIIVTYLAGARNEEDRTFANVLVGFNADTGELLWTHTQPSGNDINPNTPLYSDGYIFSSTGYGGGSWKLRLTNGGRDVEEVWYNSADNQHHGPIKVGDYIYTTAHRNRGFYCIDWKTGETKYREQSQSQSAMIYADGMLYAYDDTGGMSLIKPNPNRFELAGKFQITLGTDEHWAHPVINNGVMYIRHGDALMAYKVK